MEASYCDFHDDLNVRKEYFTLPLANNQVCKKLVKHSDYMHR